jgi:hypothetical protein
MRKEWTKEEEELLKKLCESGTHKHKDMVKYFNGRSKLSIIGKTYLMGIKNPRNRIKVPQKYHYNLNYFDEIINK